MKIIKNVLFSLIIAELIIFIVEIATFASELSSNYNIFIGALFVLGLAAIVTYDINKIIEIYDFFTSEPRK